MQASLKAFLAEEQDKNAIIYNFIKLRNALIESWKEKSISSSNNVQQAGLVMVI